MDFEDIENEDSFLVLCARAKPDDDNRKEDTCFVWQGLEHDVSPDEQRDFVKNCIGQYFDQSEVGKVRIL